MQEGQRSACFFSKALIENNAEIPRLMKMAGIWLSQNIKEKIVDVFT
jgi:hypothetical protein